MRRRRCRGRLPLAARATALFHARTCDLGHRSSCPDRERRPDPALSGPLGPLFSTLLHNRSPRSGCVLQKRATVFRKERQFGAPEGRRGKEPLPCPGQSRSVGLEDRKEDKNGERVEYREEWRTPLWLDGRGNEWPSRNVSLLFSNTQGRREGGESRRYKFL